MTEQLPISIYVSDDLKQQFEKVTSVCNKLEAQLNFQTMTANWYEDENNILFIKLCLETPNGFAEKKRQQLEEIKIYSDDVFSYYQKSEKEQVMLCPIAITDAELTLLRQENKLLTKLLQVKLQKVLNLIALQLNLNAI